MKKLFHKNYICTSLFLSAILVIFYNLKLNAGEPKSPTRPLSPATAEQLSEIIEDLEGLLKATSEELKKTSKQLEKTIKELNNTYNLNNPLKLKGLSKQEKYNKLKELDFDLLQQELKQELTIKAIEKYSVKNQILIILQKGYVQELKGFREWETLGFRPLKDSGIFIYAPINKKNKETDNYELKGFRLITIFDKLNVRAMTQQEKDRSKFYKG